MAIKFEISQQQKHESRCGFDDMNVWNSDHSVDDLWH